MKRIIAAVLLSTAFVAPAFAADSPFYAGVQLGDNYIGAFGGYQIDKMFSAEVHYLDFDTVSIPSVSTNVSSIGVAGVAMFPMKLDKAPPFYLFAKAGVERTSAKTSSAVIPTLNTTVHGTGLTLGGGAQYDFNNKVSVRLGLDVAGEADSLYLSAILKF